jgi:hypothetical protein
VCFQYSFHVVALELDLSKTSAEELRLLKIVSFNQTLTIVGRHNNYDLC